MHWLLKFIFGIKSTCFGHFLCPPSGVFHWTHNSGICHTGLLAACEQDQDGTGSVLILLASCQQTCMTYTIVVRPVKNSWWWTEEMSETCRLYSKNKFENLVHLVGFIIRIYHDARSPERQKTIRLESSLNCVLWCIPTPLAPARTCI